MSTCDLDRVPYRVLPAVYERGKVPGAVLVHDSAGSCAVPSGLIYTDLVPTGYY
jgi:hypothetical protein